MEIKYAVNMLESFIKDPSKGLPEEAFLFISRVTPMVNVDLLIKNEHNEVLMTWRADGYSNTGWHIPGGIIRFKETIGSRVKAVAKQELGAEVRFDPAPIAVNEIIHPERRSRGHFISLLINCYLITQPDENLSYREEAGSPGANEWMWHKKCPENIIDVHRVYRSFIDGEDG